MQYVHCVCTCTSDYNLICMYSIVYVHVDQTIILYVCMYR